MTVGEQPFRPLDAPAGCSVFGLTTYGYRLFDRPLFCADFAFSANPNCRKGGLIGLAAIAIALGQQSDTILKCVTVSSILLLVL